MKTNYHLEPTVFAIFGGMGDLTWRKLAPPLYDLSRDRSPPADFSIIAVDRVDLSDEKLRRRLQEGTESSLAGETPKPVNGPSSRAISITSRVISRNSRRIVMKTMPH